MTRHHTKSGKRKETKRSHRHGGIPRSGSAHEYVSGTDRAIAPGARLHYRDLVSSRFEFADVISSRHGSLVCSALDKELGQDVALKVFYQTPGCRRPVEHRFEREFSMGQLLDSCDGVVPVLDTCRLWTNEGLPLPALVMAKMSGGSLRDLLQRSHENRTAFVDSEIRQFELLCAAVSEVHEKGVILLDVKPEHALIDGGSVTLCDFGSAIAKGEATAEPSLNRLAGSARELGTAPYIAPEFILASSAETIDERTDIYALGIILYEILAPDHRPPFLGSWKQVRRCHLEAPVPRIDALSDTQMSILDCCLAKDPRDRFESADDLLAACHDSFSLSERVDSERETGQNREAGNDLYAEVERLMDTAELPELLSLMREADELHPGHPRGRGLMARLTHRVNAYVDNLEASERMLEDGDHEGALTCAERAAAANPGSTAAIEVCRCIQNSVAAIEERIVRLEHLVNRGEYAAAADIISELEQIGAIR